MKQINLLLFIITVTVCFSKTQSQEAKVDSLQKYSYSSVNEFWQQLDDIFEDQNFSSANWGVVIQSLSNGEYFYKRNENKLFIPASNLKLITTACALNVLGKDYKFKTQIYTRGKIDGTVLKGDLIVKGYGDPSISGRFYNDVILQLFSNWADSLLELGIDEISGNLIGDDNSFDDVGLGEGWSWDDESEWYSAPASALSINDNCVDIYIKPGSIGQRAIIEYQPVNKYATIINKVLTTSKDSTESITIRRERGTNIITVYGCIKENSSTKKYYSTVNNPTQYFMVLLKDILQKKGIVVNGFAVDADDLTEILDYNNAKLIFTNYSPPLSTLIRVINKDSNNFFSEQLLKILGFEKERIGSAKKGVKVVKKFLDSIGVDTDNLVMVDGSGLSRLNLISPRQIVGILSYMQRNDNYDLYYNSLPTAGVDGTLANRLQKTNAENNVRAKTGFVDGVRSLSGYMYTGDKELVAFSMILNNTTVPIKLAENLQDLVCIRLSNFRRK